MPILRFLCALLSTGAIVIPAAPGLPAPAQAAAQPAWRIVKIARGCPDDSLSAVAATGPGDAWAIGAPNSGSNRPGCGADVEHWNGEAWHRIPVPRGEAVSGVTGLPPLAASSPRNAWIFPGCTISRWGGPCRYTRALRWNGTAWRKTTMPSMSAIGSAATLGPSSTWVFGSVEHANSTTTPRAARYDGHRWRAIHPPVAPVAVSTPPHRGLWAIGPSAATAGKPLARQVFLAAHWAGRSWTTIPVPPVTRPKGASALRAGYLAAVSRHDLWWAYQVTGAEPSPLGLEHWNGRHWRAVRLPAKLAGIGAMARDGHRGIWLLGDASNFDLTQYWYHYSHGRWTRQIVPSPKEYTNMLFAMAWVPGTTSLLAAGEADASNGNKTEGVIARYASRRSGRGSSQARLARLPAPGPAT